MGMSPRVLIVAAMEREIAPLLRGFIRERNTSGLRVFRREDTTLVCGGIGMDAASHAASWAIAEYDAEVVMSVGFAGALVPGCKAGDVITPGTVINADTSESFSVSGGHGVLVSTSTVASGAGKRDFASKYGAQAVDMEAAAVGRVARSNGILFFAIKAISDELGFAMPPLQKFIDESGHFRASELLTYAAVRPSLWPVLARLGIASRKASSQLCSWLENQMSRHFRDIVENQTAGK
jgi:adenosylhomocysteine nucleosidase